MTKTSKTWDLKKLLHGLHKDIQSQLADARELMGHPVSKGDTSESVWLELFSKYLPERYRTESAVVVDSKGNFSDQIDVVIFDRQYTPFIFLFQGQIVVPAESVYAVFECKQDLNKGHVEYAQKKLESVRALERTSLPIPYADGVYPAKKLMPILGGILTFESTWSPSFGDAFHTSLSDAKDEALDLGCVAEHGFFFRDEETGEVLIDNDRKPATGFLFKLISELQKLGTVPMINVQAYADWLTD